MASRCVTRAAAKLWPAGENRNRRAGRLGLLRHPPGTLLTNAGKGAEVTIMAVRTNETPVFRLQPDPALNPPVSVAAPTQRMLAVRTAGDPNLLLNPIRSQVREMDANQPLGRPITLAEVFGQEVVQPRLRDRVVIFGLRGALS